MLFLAPAAESANPAPPTISKPGGGKCLLKVHATGFRSQKGVAAGQVFNSPNGWPEENDKAYANDEVPISGSHTSLSFHLPPGRYGVVVLHDENGNHKLDRDFLGIPTEGFGFANNPHVFLKSPSFQAASVNVACPVTNIDVKMIYK